MQIFKIRSSFR